MGFLTIVPPQRLARRVALAVVVVAGTLLLFRLRRFRPEGLPELIALAAAPVVLVAVLRRSWREVVIWSAYMGGFVMFAFLRAGADNLGIPARMHYVIELERLLFGGIVPTSWLQRTLYDPGAISLFDWTMIVVHLSYFIIPHALGFFFWAYRPRYFERYVIAVIATYYAALVIQMLVPTVPPWLAGQEEALPVVYRVVDDALMGLSPAAYQQGIMIVGENDVAAMPSLHSAVTVIAAIGFSRLGRAAAWIGGFYAAMMAFALVYLGEHYAIDTVAGALLASIVWFATKGLCHSQSRPGDSLRVAHSSSERRSRAGEVF